jgi:predicted nucleotidyltransferase
MPKKKTASPSAGSPVTDYRQAAQFYQHNVDWANRLILGDHLVVMHPLARLYGRRLKGLYLYGSYARGDQQAESDLDTLVVLDRYERYGAELDRTSELVSSLSLRYGVSISVIFMREQEWREGDTPLLRNVGEEALARDYASGGSDALD